MGVYLRGNRYHFKKMVEGKVYYKPLRIRKGQESLLSARVKQVEEEIIAQHYGIPYKGSDSTTFQDYSLTYLSQKKYKKTWERDKQRLAIMAEIVGDPPLRSMGKPDIQRLEKALFARGLKPSTVNRYFEILNNMFNTAIEDEVLDKNPCRFYKRYTEDGSRRALSQDELRKILSAAKEIQESPRSNIQSLIYDIIILALSTGMRLSEMLNLKRIHVDLERNRITLPISHTKYKRRGGGRQRVKVIVMNTTAMRILSKHLARSEYVLPVGWRDASTVFHVVRKIRKMTGIEDFTFHQLRHTVATFLTSKVDIATSRIILGHSDIQTTLKYSHPSSLEEGVAKLDTLVADLQGNA